ncbi:unnamed protein product, partial [Heterotrigona itama]
DVTNGRVKSTKRPGFLSKKFLPDACAEHLSEPLPAARAFKLDFPGELFTCLYRRNSAFNARHKTGFPPFHSHAAWSPEELLCPINPLRTVRFPGIATSDVAIVFAVSSRHLRFNVCNVLIAQESNANRAIVERTSLPGKIGQIDFVI